MIVIPHEQILACDIDDTLVTMNGVTKDSCDFAIKDPYDVLGTMYFKAMWPNINLVKRGFQRGLRYFAWSFAGVKHAQAVVLALNMEPYFEFVMTKPTRYIDDKPVTEWLTGRTWLPPDFPGWEKKEFV